jgi:hypothetical protein
MFAQERTIRPALAGIVVISFLLPFVQITCGGQRIASMTGIDMAIGKTVKPPDMAAMMGSPETHDYRYDSDLAKPYLDTTSQDSINQAADPTGKGEIKPEPTAAAAFILSVIALVAALGAARKAMLTSAVCSGLAAISLFVLKTGFDGQIPPEASAIVVVEWTTAFWVAMISAAVLAAFTARLLSDKSDSIERPRLVIQSYADKHPTSSTPR